MFGAHFLTDGGETRNDLKHITDRSCYKDQEASSFVRFGRRTEKLCPGKVADDMLPHNCYISPAIDRIGLIPSGTDRYCKKGYLLRHRLRVRIFGRFSGPNSTVLMYKNRFEVTGAFFSSNCRSSGLIIDTVLVPNAVRITPAKSQQHRRWLGASSQVVGWSVDTVRVEI